MYSYKLCGNRTNGNVIKFTVGLQLCINILSAIPFAGQPFTPSRRCSDGVINDTDYSASFTLNSLHYAQSAQALCWPPDPFSVWSLAGLTPMLVNQTKGGSISDQNGWPHNLGGGTSGAYMLTAVEFISKYWLHKAASSTVSWIDASFKSTWENIFKTQCIWSYEKLS